jgi:hypothetical protein
MPTGNIYLKSQVTFVWDKDFIESQFDIKFESETEFVDWVSDKSVELIKESVENKQIWWMVKVDPLEFKP